MYSVTTANIITGNTIGNSDNYSINQSVSRSSLLPEQAWLKLTNVENGLELSSQYADICHQYKAEKKWVLFINPEEASLEQLALTYGVDISKVLCVSFKGKNKTNNLVDERSAHLDIEQIKKVLSRGNCSAVILSNASFDDNEIAALDSSARLGETQCVLLKNARKNNIENTSALSSTNIH